MMDQKSYLVENYGPWVKIYRLDKFINIWFYLTNLFLLKDCFFFYFAFQAMCINMWKQTNKNTLFS